jgi:hypothetical protein
MFHLPFVGISLSNKTIHSQNLVKLVRDFELYAFLAIFSERQIMSRLNNDTSISEYEPPMLFGLESLDKYLSVLDTFINEKIDNVNDIRPKDFANEEEFLLDGFIDEHIIELGGISQILIESALVSYYSYLEGQLFSICKGLDSSFDYGKIKADSDIQKCRKFIFETLNIDEKKEKEWNSIMKFHLMRKFIVHANISEKNYQNLLKEAEINDEIWFNSKTKDFSISIEYVKEFSKSISAFLSEIDHQIFLYNHCRFV